MNSSSAICVVLSCLNLLLQTVSLSPVPEPLQENVIVSNVNGDISSQRMTRQLHYFDPPPFYQYDNINGGGNIHNCAHEGIRFLSSTSSTIGCRPLSRYFLRIKRSAPLQIPEDYVRRPYKGQSTRPRLPRPYQRPADRDHDDVDHVDDEITDMIKQ